ncbi:mucin-2 isoform X2 [Pimephales promelas]|uniref:mucin-2 isoform X2 n=1 Tax=Pimephales promelas TaxID=90988 RepID=UPI0019557CE6|nr:mucin-2 isoform X2 [Pimephales promelas]
MLRTHQLFLLILISTSGLIATSTVDPTMSMPPSTTTPVLSSTNSTSDSTASPNDATFTDTSEVTSVPSGNTTTQFPINATTPLLSTDGGNVTSPPLSTQGNVTISSTSAPENATSSSASTSGNTITSLVTTASNSTSPLVPTLGNATNHPVTAPGNTTTTPSPDPGNTTTFPSPYPGNTTTTPSPYPGNSTNLPSPDPGNTTTTPSPDPGNTTTTPSPDPGNTTTFPSPYPGNTTTTPSPYPGNTTTTPSPDPGNTTTLPSPDPGNSTTTPSPDPGNSTTTPSPDPGNSTTLPQTTRGNYTTPPITTPGNSTVSTITTPSNVTITAQTTSATCPSVPCPPLSVCVNSICQCLTGTFPLNNACVETKSFPSSLKVNRTFVPAMHDPKTPEFHKVANEILIAVNAILRNQPNYINSTVLRLTPGSIVASVNSYFEPNSPVTQESITSAISTGIQNATTCGMTNCGILAGAQYNVSNLCEQELSPCDVDTTECKAKDGIALCTCKPGYVPSLYQVKSCRVCPSGYKAQGSDCVQCSFGYSGFNCNDSSLLALVVVACVLGGLLLIVILAVLIYICVTHRKRSDDNHFSSPYAAEEFRATWPSQDITHIPRVTLTSSSSNDVFGNNLEMVEGPGKKGHTNGLKIRGKKGSYDLTADDMRTFKDPNPTRYSYLVGHENPYFIQGDEKR